MPRPDKISALPPLAMGGPGGLACGCDMTLQEQYDAAMFDFSRGEFAAAIVKLKKRSRKTRPILTRSLRSAWRITGWEILPAQLLKVTRPKSFAPRSSLSTPPFRCFT